VLLTIHGTHSNHLSHDVDGNGSLQLPTRISRHEGVFIPNSTLRAPDKRVRPDLATESDQDC
jgi:hypothetical protein